MSIGFFNLKVNYRYKTKKKEIIKKMEEIKDRTGEIQTLDDALQEMLSNYKMKSKR